MNAETRAFFPRLIGNDSLKNNLSVDFATGKSAHAYIIEGPSGSGKRTAARLIASAVLCENRNDAHFPLPCGKCDTCKKIADGLSVDVITISNGERASISVDAIRQIKETLLLTPNDGDKRIYIIENAHLLTAQAQNALLLSLEEPPPYVMFLLLTEDSSALLETVRSRAPTLRMELFSATKIAEYLSSVPNLTSAMRQRIPAASHLSGGSIGAALALVEGTNDETALYDTAEEFVYLLLEGKKTEILSYVTNKLPRERDKTCRLLTLMRFALRDGIASRRDGELLFFTETPQKMRKYSVKRLTHISAALLSAENDILANCSQSAVMTALALRI